MPAFRSLAEKSLQRLLTHWLPCTCALCRQESAGILCDACRHTYFQPGLSHCPQCGLHVTGQEPGQTPVQRCGDCLRNPPAFDRTIAVCDYAPPQDQLVLSLKFAHQLALAPLFAGLLRDAILRQAEQHLPDMLLAVPLGRQRLQDRGFNQALEIARPLAHQLGIALYSRGLQRIRETLPQTSLTPDARIRNMRNAFMLDERITGSLRGKHVGIVDDVITTGMTLHEIATMLKRFGAATVSNYVFARTQYHSS